METGVSLVDLGELSKPITVLIERASDAVGGLFRPYQIRRVAEAEAQAAKVKAESDIEISELQQRAALRFFNEEAMKQVNMESITRKAIPGVREDAKPDEIEIDWITNFYDKCRIVSDQEMQELWARILAEQANTPGSFSKRTVNHLASLDKSDAELFANLCSFACTIEDAIQPIVLNANEPLYNNNGIDFGSLKHLDDIGFLSFNPVATHSHSGLPQTTIVGYQDEQIEIGFPADQGNCTLNIGAALFSRVGQELARVAVPPKIPTFIEYLLQNWGGGNTIRRVSP